jgi:peroxiredoxin
MNATEAPVDFVAALKLLKTQNGNTISGLSQQSPVLVIFVRHFGCTFCREALADITKLQPELNKEGVKVIFVHLHPEAEANKFFAGYGLGDIERISDPEHKLYDAFELKRATSSAMFDVKVWWRATFGGAIIKHGIGRPTADVMRMPGVFLIQGDKIISAFRHKSMADRPNYRDLMTCPMP